MKARLYVEGWVDVEVPTDKAAQLTVRNGWVVPTLTGDPNIEELVAVFLNKDADFEVGDWSPVCRRCGWAAPYDDTRRWRELDLCEPCAQKVSV